MDEIDDGNIGDIIKDTRIRTGINGFDELVNGGIPEGNIVLVSGTAGTGKSLFSFEFIYHGAKDFNDPGVYITLEEIPERFIHNIRKLGFLDANNLIKESKIGIVKTEIFDIDKLVGSIEDMIDQYGARRIVIDSISVLSAFAEKPFLVRRAIMDVATMLKRQNVTTLFTCGSSQVSKGQFGTSVEEYVVDGIIVLFHQITGTQFLRAIGVVKMRGSSHTESLHPMAITENGIVILREPFSEEFKIQ